MTDHARAFSLPARYYARRGADWSAATPARTYEGEKEIALALTTANTAIICMHTSNTGMGYPGAPEYTCEPRVKPYFDELNARRKVMVEEHMAPFFAAARRIGLRIMYIVAGWPCAEHYPAYRQIAARVKPIPPKPGQWRPPKAPGPEAAGDEFNPGGKVWRREMVEESLGGGFGTTGDCDIPAPVAAGPEDWVVTWTPHASTLLNEQGIWNILLVGTDTSGWPLPTPPAAATRGCSTAAAIWILGRSISGRCSASETSTARAVRSSARWPRSIRTMHKCRCR
ncbi:MAG: hypothetical protein GXY33_05280 [Phycisphaerae bacterium]|nr:hypothetical protein [Phycisphaerae bacterium]